MGVYRILSGTHGEALKGLYFKGLLSKNTGRSIAQCHSHLQVACLVASALANGICKCRRPVRLWTDFSRPRGWRVTTALGNPFPCRTALGNPFPCRKVCFAQEAPLDKPPLWLPQNPKHGCKDTVTAFFALIALVAWKCLLDSALRKLSVYPRKRHEAVQLHAVSSRSPAGLFPQYSERSPNLAP